MKIWCQSSGAMGKDTAWSPYEQSLNHHIPRVVRPDTKVDLRGTDATIPGLARHRAPATLASAQAVRNAMRAEEQGYDAFVLISTNDLGASEIRELVKIPVVFITETCVHLASLLSDKFALIAANDEALKRLTEVAERYNPGNRMTPGGCLDLAGYANIMDMFKNPKRYVEPITKKIKEIGAGGANLLIPTPGALTQWLVDNNIREVDGIVLMDTVGAVLKTAELLVDLKNLGMNRSPRYYRSPDPEIVAGLKKIYGV